MKNDKRWKSFQVFKRRKFSEPIFFYLSKHILSYHFSYKTFASFRKHNSQMEPAKCFHSGKLDEILQNTKRNGETFIPLRYSYNFIVLTWTSETFWAFSSVSKTDSLKVHFRWNVDTFVVFIVA